ncbi:MAG: hypothetical protein HOJ46_01410 [Halieaceae bacterium]|jgi:hypothetical protein|nr:hypothetical protein [Halieaceae bacterium]
MSDSISKTTHRAGLRAGNKVVHRAPGSPAQHARKHLSRKQSFKPDLVQESSDDEDGFDERAEQAIAGAHSLAETVNHLQQAANLIASTEQTLASLAAHNATFLYNLERRSEGLTLPDHESLAEQTKHLAKTLRQTLAASISGGERLFMPGGPRLLKTLLSGIAPAHAVCPPYSRISNQNALRLEQLALRLDAVGGEGDPSCENLTIEPLKHFLLDYNQSIARDRTALSLLQDRLSQTLTHSLIDSTDVEFGADRAPPSSTYQALSERTTTQLRKRPGATLIYNDVASEFAKSLLKD